MEDHMNRSVAWVGRLGTSVVVVALAACSAAVTPTTRTESTYVPGGGASGASALLSVSGENGTVSVVIGAPLQSVWRVMPVAFDSSGVQLTLIDPKKHLMANEGFKIRQKLGKERLSTYFECGTTQVGPNADSYELYVTVHSYLEPVKGDTTKTRMTVAVSGAAKPLQFSQDYSRCTSKTILERRMVDAVATMVRK
jgi:hypothetical protein